MKARKLTQKAIDGHRTTESRPLSAMPDKQSTAEDRSLDAARKSWIATLNRDSPELFSERLAGLFERSPWVCARAWELRPFADWDDLHAKLRRALGQGTLEQKRALICAHPDLAVQAEARPHLTAESQAEQAGAGLDRLDSATAARFQGLNQRYRERFGFPFILCVKRVPAEAILPIFLARLEKSGEQEFAAALEEIGKIAEVRLQQLVDGTR